MSARIIASISVALISIGLGKLYDFSNYNQFRGLLERTDPIISVMTYKDTVLLAAIIEIGLGISLMISRQKSRLLMAILCYVVIIGVYRFMLLINFSPDPCPCLGSLLKPLHLPKMVENALPIMLLVYIEVAGVTSLLLIRGKSLERQNV